MAEFDISNQTQKPTPKSANWIPLAIGAAVLLLIIGFFAWQLMGDKSKESSNTTTNSSESTPPPTPTPTPEPPAPAPNPTPPPTPPAAPMSATISYTASGFSPASVTIASGGTLTIVNSSGNSLEFASDPHPSHTTNSQLNAGNVTSSKKIVLTTKGTFGVHNHDRSSHEATIIVK